MRTLIISDVHANLTALEAVLEDAKPYDRVWCLGDVVGYGPDPNACIERIKPLPGLRCVKGNHDAASLGEIDIRAFNYEARDSLSWLKSELSLESYHWLQALDEVMVVDDVTLVHGSPRNPVWEYIMDSGCADENMQAFDTHICLVGHTHIPVVYQLEDDLSRTTRLIEKSPGEALSINQKSIINPGSVGQPRDLDARASYIIYDDDAGRWFFHRVVYDCQEVQGRILAAGLPIVHATRLEGGW